MQWKVNRGVHGIIKHNQSKSSGKEKIKYRREIGQDQAHCIMMDFRSYISVIPYYITYINKYKQA